MNEENRIIRDARVFTEQFIPKLISHRDNQLNTVRDSLNNILKEQSPRNVFFYGDTGTGKTSVAKYVAEELSSYSSSILKSYVNCWLYPSRFKILYNILQDFGKLLNVHRKGTPTDELFDILQKRTQENFCVIILDEADKLEDGKILYDLLDLANIGLILISNSQTAFYRMDSRVRSRLSSADNIEFPRYKEEEIMDILKNRAEWGLLPEVIKNKQLERISSLAGGDARVAINILRIVVEEAEKGGEEKIKDSYIENALSKAIKKDNRETLENMNLHQKILYSIIKENNEIKPPELYERYKKICKEKGTETIGDRTIRKHLERMAKYKLIHAVGKDRWRVYKVRN